MSVIITALVSKHIVEITSYSIRWLSPKTWKEIDHMGGGCNYEQGKEPQGSTTGGEFPDQMSDKWLLNGVHPMEFQFFRALIKAELIFI
jgi:hypothetical protein